MRRNPDHRCQAEPSPQPQTLEHLERLATGREGDDAVVLADDPQIAMGRFSWVQVDCSCPGRTQGGGELPGDEEGFC